MTSELDCDLVGNGKEQVLLRDGLAKDLRGRGSMLEDKRLVRDVKRGDKESLRRIYEKYKDELVSIAACLLGDAGTAEDVLHEVIISFAKGINRFYLHGSLRDYFITCIMNRIRDLLRAETYQVVELHPGRLPVCAAEGMGQSAVDNEGSQRIAEALKDLPYQQTEVIVLHLHGGLKFRRIAAMQDVSVSTVQARYHYGLDKLRSVLTD